MLAASEALPMETVGGYRLIRKLGSGERAEIFLGHAGSREPPDRDRIAAIKLYRPGTDDTAIDREIEALARASSRHLLELRDLATTSDGRVCLILPRLGSGTLARLLAVRGTVEAGEAVSILVPLLEAVMELHRVGVAHGSVCSGSVLFDDRGAPVLAGFGRASLIGAFPATEGGRSLTPAQLDEDPGANDDRNGVLEVVRIVLERLAPGGNHAPLSDLRGILAGEPRGEALLADLIQHLFDLAAARPIRFDEGEGFPTHDATEMRLRPRPMPSAELVAVESDGGAAPTGGVLRRGNRGVRRRRSPSESPVGAALDVHPLRAVRTRVLTALAPVRMPVWIAGGAGLGALVVALTVIPAAHSEPVPSAPPTSSPYSPRSEATSAAPTRTQTPLAPATGSPPGARMRDAAAVTGDDPVAAAVTLLSDRAQCFATRSTSCFGLVDQAGSVMIEADRDLVRRLGKGGALPGHATLDGWTPRLIQRLGDLAILQLIPGDATATEQVGPAPLLLIRSGAGWRIRDLTLG